MSDVPKVLYPTLEATSTGSVEPLQSVVPTAASAALPGPAPALSGPGSVTPPPARSLSSPRSSPHSALTLRCLDVLR